jgi:hypothetical protein
MRLLGESKMDGFGLLVPLPLWVIGHRDRKLNDLLKGHQPDGMVATLVFTKEDLATSFLESRPKSDYIPVRVDDENTVLGLLNAIQARGITHVAFVSSPGKESTTHPVSDFRAAFQRAVDKDESAV